MKIGVLGGGGFRVPLMHRALLASQLSIDEIVLHDVSPERLSVIAAVVSGDGPAVRTTTDLDDAVVGADVVFAALRVGGVDGRVADEREALALGLIGQETVGAGGLASALRTVPVVDRVAERVASLAPSAWVVSMTNPAGVVTEAMSHTLGERVIGVCDSPVGMIRRACVALGIDPGESLAAVTASVDVDYLGLNHLGWLRALRVDGVDRLPELLHDPDRLVRIEEGALFGPELLRALGSVPNEYLYWYYARIEAYRALLDAGRTRGEHVRDRQLEFYKAATAAPRDAAALWQQANDERNRSYFAELRTGERDEADVATGGYETVAVGLAEALTSGAPARLVLNVRNGTSVSGLPPDAVIETVCRVDRSGAVSLPVEPPSTHELGLMAAVKASEQAIIDAARTRSPVTTLRAFALHPLVDSLRAAHELAARALARATT